MKIFNKKDPQEGDSIIVDKSKWIVLYDNLQGSEKYLIQNKDTYRFISKEDTEFEIIIEENIEGVNDYFNKGDFVTLEYSGSDQEIFIVKYDRTTYEGSLFYECCLRKHSLEDTWRCINTNDWVCIRGWGIGCTMRFSTTEEIKLLEEYSCY